MISIHSDPLRELKIVKRWALLAIVVAVSALLPLYGLLLGLSVSQLGWLALATLLPAIIAIEIASRWQYRLHRLYAYPHHLGYELASIHDFRQACQRSADMVGQWLRAPAVVVGLFNEDGQTLTPI